MIQIERKAVDQLPLVAATALLAIEFRRQVRASIAAADLIEVDAENADEIARTGDVEGSACATHKFTDPNQCMLDAFQELFGRELDLGSYADTRMIEHAWTAAKISGFSN
jgi:hypothetical protein